MPKSPKSTSNKVAPMPAPAGENKTNKAGDPPHAHERNISGHRGSVPGHEKWVQFINTTFRVGNSTTQSAPPGNDTNETQSASRETKPPLKRLPSKSSFKLSSRTPRDDSPLSVASLRNTKVVSPATLETTHETQEPPDSQRTKDNSVPESKSTLSLDKTRQELLNHIVSVTSSLSLLRQTTGDSSLVQQLSSICDNKNLNPATKLQQIVNAAANYATPNEKSSPTSGRNRLCLPGKSKTEATSSAAVQQLAAALLDLDLSKCGDATYVATKMTALSAGPETVGRRKSLK